MKIGVLSDTHGNARLMTRAAELLVKRFGAAWLIHLGDNWEDLEFLTGCGVPVSGVPGLWCDAYQDPRIPKVRADTFAGICVAYAHCENDLRPLPSAVGLVLTGHTHHAIIQAREGIPWLNPGHLTGAVHHHQPASFGLAAISENGIYLAIIEINGGIRASRRFPRQDMVAETR